MLDAQKKKKKKKKTLNVATMVNEFGRTSLVNTQLKTWIQ